jgi:hypothetical protein
MGIALEEKSCINELDICIGGIQGRDVTEAGKMETSEVVELTWPLRSSYLTPERDKCIFGCARGC